jgi:hypothetical protein
MPIPAWIEHFTHFPAETVPNAVCLGCSALNVATIEGTQWRGNVTTSSPTEPLHPLAILNASRLEAFADYCRARGLVALTHNIPQGVSMAAEIALAIASLEVIPHLVIDYEPIGLPFWDVAESEVPNYIGPIRAAHPDAWIGVTCDPTVAARVALWAPYVDALYHTAYWEEGNATTAQIDAIHAGWQANAPEKAMHVLFEANDPDQAREESIISYARQKNLVAEAWRLEVITTAFANAVNAVT